MKYGNFIDEGRAFIVTTPFTPTPWTNKLFNDDFQIDITQRLQGGGRMLDENHSWKTFNKDENQFYINIDGKSYSLCRGEGDSFICEHRLYQTEITEKFGDITVKIRVFIPVKGHRVFWTFSISNNSDKKSCVSIFSVFPFFNPGYMSHSGRYDEEGGYIYYTGFPYFVKYDDKEIEEKKVRFRYVMSDFKPFSYECNKQRFFGCDDSSVMPLAVTNNACCNAPCELEDCVAAMQHKFDIESGESASFNILLGIEKTKESVDKISKEFPDFNLELESVKQLWEKRCSCFMIETPDTELNYLTNYWLKRQLVFFAKTDRGNSLYYSVRNQLQDYLGYAMIDPKDALKHALKIVELQHHNGFIKAHYTINGFPERDLCFTKHSDSYIWFIICLIEVIEKNCDESLYQMKVGYFDSPVKETLLTHLKKAAYYMSTQIGEHGLCLMLDGDWNDPVNGPGHLGKGESTWNSMALCYAIERLNSVEFDHNLDAFRKKLLENINKYCWDGEWYIAGINDDGIPYGSHKDKEAQKFLNAQTWAIISGVATGERREQVVKTIESMGNKFGYSLISPSFSEYNPIWGRVSIKMRGTTENGSIYCHSVMFKAFADCICGDGDAARNTIMRILPTNPQHSPEESLQIPIYYSNYYFGFPDENYGRSSCHYRTGTVAWHFWVILEYIFGLQMSATNGIQLNPCLPKEWNNTKLTRKFGDKTYELTVSDGETELKILD